MQLADVLSKPPSLEFKEIEHFLGKKTLTIGGQRKITAGQIGVNYFCKTCVDIRTFWSEKELYCIALNESMLSVDSVLKCHCGASVAIWYVVDFYTSINDLAPKARVIKKVEKLSDKAEWNENRHKEFSDFLKKSQQAYHHGLGAGAMVYLRKIFEKITIQTAQASGINLMNEKRKRKTFKDLLKEVDEQRGIIPREFSANRYRLFGELSDVLHGEYNEELALLKYESLQRLIIGILDNVKNNQELIGAINSLGWNEALNRGEQNE